MLYLTNGGIRKTILYKSREWGYIFWYSRSLKVMYFKPINMATYCKHRQIGMHKSLVLLKGLVPEFSLRISLYYVLPTKAIIILFLRNLFSFLSFLRFLAHHNHSHTRPCFVLHQIMFPFINPHVTLSITLYKVVATNK